MCLLWCCCWWEDMTECWHYDQPGPFHLQSSTIHQVAQVKSEPHKARHWHQQTHWDPWQTGKHTGYQDDPRCRKIYKKEIIPMIYQGTIWSAVLDAYQYPQNQKRWTNQLPKLPGFTKSLKVSPKPQKHISLKHTEPVGPAQALKLNQLRCKGFGHPKFFIMFPVFSCLLLFLFLLHKAREASQPHDLALCAYQPFPWTAWWIANNM